MTTMSLNGRYYGTLQVVIKAHHVRAPVQMS